MMVEGRELSEYALKGMLLERDRLNDQIAAMEVSLNGNGHYAKEPPEDLRVAEGVSRVAVVAQPAVNGDVPKKRVMSAATRRKMARAMKKRWAVAQKAGKSRL